MLNIYFSRGSPDRWIKGDRYIINPIKKIISYNERKSSQLMRCEKLKRGLKQVGKKYNFNDFWNKGRRKGQLDWIIGTHELLIEEEWKRPVIIGPVIFAHPIDHENIMEEYPNIKKIVVQSEWKRKMFYPYFGENVTTWPAGIDIEKWKDDDNIKNEFDFLLYNKIHIRDKKRYDHVRPIDEDTSYKEEVVEPIKNTLKERGLRYREIKYGDYTHKEFLNALQRSKAAIFLCTNESQGFAYQEMLSTNVPVFAWDRGGYWRDPEYFPDRVRFKPTTSVPYWDERCGMKFRNVKEFKEKLRTFCANIRGDHFSPRSYVRENLSLEVSACRFVEIYNNVRESL